MGSILLSERGGRGREGGRPEGKRHREGAMTADLVGLLPQLPHQIGILVDTSAHYSTQGRGAEVGGAAHIGENLFQLRLRWLEELGELLLLVCLALLRTATSRR